MPKGCQFPVLLAFHLHNVNRMAKETKKGTENSAFISREKNTKRTPIELKTNSAVTNEPASGSQSHIVDFSPVVFDVLVQLLELLQLHNDGDDR